MERGGFHPPSFVKKTYDLPAKLTAKGNYQKMGQVRIQTEYLRSIVSRPFISVSSDLNHPVAHREHQCLETFSFD